MDHGGYHLMNLLLKDRRDALLEEFGPTRNRRSAARQPKNKSSTRLSRRER
jgi:hypothetical protein